MTPRAQRAIDDWNREVDDEMARMVERGVPPPEAARRAQQRVSDRRALAASQPDEGRLREALKQCGLGA